jgi:hypothetical protein
MAGRALSLRPCRVNFAKTSDFNRPGPTAWPRYIAQTPAHVAFDDKGVTPLGPLRAEICELLERL